MKNMKVVIIILVIIIIAILSVLTMIQVKNNKEPEEGKQLRPTEEFNNKDIDYSTFYTVSNCVQKYITYESVDLNEKETITEDGYVNSTTAEELGITDQETKVNLVSQMLDKDYIEKNNIKVKLDNKSLKFVPQKIVGMEKENISKYAIYGELIEMATLKKVRNEYFIVTLDEINNTFQIVPILEEKYKKVEEIHLEIDITKIDKNANNTYMVADVKQTDMISKYFSNYKENVIFNLEKAYTLLDETYRNARFGNLEEFKKYVEENKETFDKATVSKYKVDVTDEYTQYVVIDQNDNYYIFRENAIMDYHVILDTYTIDLPEFIEKYNKATEQEKVALNINKFIQAINAKDYKYAYNKLAQGFKDNYFQTQESFEQYIKQKLYKNNEIKFNNFNNQANIYTYTTIITDKETKQTKQQNFVVKLKEGTDFEMSFEV